MSVLFISHDLGLVGEFADTVVVMRAGQVREAGPVARIFGAPQDAYTRALIACRPRLDQRPRRLPVIEDFLAPTPAAASAEPRPPRAATQRALVEVAGLRKEYHLKTGLFGRHTVEAVSDASFTLGPGRTLGVVGESGSGKTTLGMMLMRLIEATAGQVRFDGADVLHMDRRQLLGFRRRVQIIFQNPYASLNPRFTVGHILAEPMRIHGIGANEAERNARIGALLDRVGLERASLGKYPHEFSGGQRQRIAIARALSLRPELVICDESVSALDVSVQANVLNLLLDLQDELGVSYLFISHDLAVVKYMADDILVMSAGQIVERGTGESIYGNPQHEYTRKLLSSIPRGFEARARS
jgi:peptide/nickel transport system ATP-binding protein